MKKTTLIIRGQPAPQGGSHHGWHHPTRPVVIRNMQGEVIARLGEEQGCTDDLSTAFLDELDLCTCKNKTAKTINYA